MICFTLRCVFAYHCVQEVPSALCGVADVILCADCLFFEDFHAGLLACCDALLKPVVPPGVLHVCFLQNPARHLDFAVHLCSGGPAPSVWALAPSRGGSLERFVGTAVRAGFDVCVRDGVCAGAVCAAAAANTAFDPDLHRPRMVILTRKA